jgi:hypothetical protein
MILERRWNSIRDSQLYCRRGSIQLWQFLLALLEDGINGTIIIWTGKGLEFKLVEPEEVNDFESISFFFCKLMIFLFLGSTFMGCTKKSSINEL